MNKTHSALHKYLALYKKLDIPGIGGFTVDSMPATLQFTDKQLLPPQNSVRFVPGAEPTNNHFYSFLSREWDVDKVIAIRRFKEEAEGMAEELQQHGAYNLPGIGLLQKGTDDLRFTPSKFLSQPLFSLLPAERVLRKNAQHTVLVGEQEHIKAHTLPQAEEMLYEEKPTKERWKLYAWILAIFAVLVIVFYYIWYK